MSGTAGATGDALLDGLIERHGRHAVLTGDEVAARPAGWHGMPTRAMAIVRPADTAGVAATLAACHAAGRPVVAHGGLTGLSDGAVTVPGDIALSLERLAAIEEVDVANRTMTVQAGVPLQAVQEAADAAGLFFPLDFGARGTATVGGFISTNAGGNRVIRYGMTRDMVLGLEAVLADGTVVESLSKVLKNNTGYDLKQLFVGSEGTLGIITRAVLRLWPKPRSRSTALLAVPDFDAVTRLLAELEAALGGTLATFEVMWDSYFKLSAPTAWPSGNLPLDPATTPFAVLVEMLGGDPEGDPARFDQALESVYRQGVVTDAAVAHSDSDAAALWRVRDNVECLEALQPYVIFDVSAAIGDMDGYLDEVGGRLAARWPGYRLAVFGHLGDGNLHLVVTADDPDPAVKEGIKDCVYQPLQSCRGSVSAEHGVGLARLRHLPISRNPEELALMRTLKRALDPQGILNPGKVLPEQAV